MDGAAGADLSPERSGEKPQPGFVAIVNPVIVSQFRIRVRFLYFHGQNMNISDSDDTEPPAGASICIAIAFLKRSKSSLCCQE